MPWIATTTSDPLKQRHSQHKLKLIILYIFVCKIPSVMALSRMGYLNWFSYHPTDNANQYLKYSLFCVVVWLFGFPPSRFNAATNSGRLLLPTSPMLVEPMFMKSLSPKLILKWCRDNAEWPNRPGLWILLQSYLKPTGSQTSRPLPAAWFGSERFSQISNSSPPGKVNVLGLPGAEWAQTTDARRHLSTAKPELQ